MIAAFMETMRMIKIEHSIFALPFAMVSAFWAADGVPAVTTLALIVVAMVFARSAAMAFNRWLDADIDGRNPRTAIRSIPAGKLSAGFALGFTIACSLLFVLTTYFINQLAMMLAVPFLAILLGYSYMKRVTPLCHLVLGLALGLSPLGAWIAVTGEFHTLPVWLGLAVMTWTAGFDIIYACQDLDFDQDHHLHSIPATFGKMGALYISRVLHLVMIGILIALGLMTQQHWLYWVGVVMVIGLLGYEHALVWDGDLSKVGVAFFNMNGLVSLLFGATTITATLIA